MQNGKSGMKTIRNKSKVRTRLNRIRSKATPCQTSQLNTHLHSSLTRHTYRTSQLGNNPNSIKTRHKCKTNTRTFNHKRIIPIPITFNNLELSNTQTLLPSPNHAKIPLPNHKRCLFIQTDQMQMPTHNSKLMLQTGR